MEQKLADTMKKVEVKKLVERIANLERELKEKTDDLLDKRRALEIVDALEKVRARTINMRSSSELSETSAVLFNQLKELGIRAIRSGVGIFDNDNEAVEIWVTTISDNQEVVRILDYFSLHIHPVFKNIIPARNQNKPYSVTVLRGNDVRHYYKTMSTYVSQAQNHSYHQEEFFYSFFFAQGTLDVNTSQLLTEEECVIVTQFAQVFGLIYTRFLDLQRAEAQTREALIQRSLDQLRAEIASMRTAHDLERITPLIWQELVNLDVEFFRCGVFIINEEEQMVHAYLSTPDGKSLGVLRLPFKGLDTTRKIVENWREGTVYGEYWDRQQFESWVQSMVKLGQITEIEKFQTSDSPIESLYLHFAPFTQGMLYVGSTEYLHPVQVDLVKSLADSFSVAYARYEDLKMLEDAKRSENIQLRKINELKTNLYTNITHEFRTPLTVILGMADQLKESIQKQSLDQADRSVQMIRRNGENLLKLVNEMLDMAKLDSGGLELQMIQGDMVLFTKYVADSFQSMANTAQISLEVCSRIDEMMMDFDAGKMTSILSNLISNAIKFTPQGGTVVVTLDKAMEKNIPCLYLAVSDNGSGIAPSDLPHIFDRFYQTDRSLRRKSEGTGIGLAYTRELVNLMQGAIEVNSEPGKGSEFKVSIPVSNDAVKGEPSSIRELSRENIPVAVGLISAGRQVNITDLPLVLIIEDNPDVTQYLKWCLEDKYLPIHAPDGLVGVELAYEQIPDIIICDVMMPGRDGFEVCALLKTDVRTDHIPIIMLTAKATSRDRITGLSKGADAYLTKPFNREELLTHLEQLILVRKRIFQKFERDGFAGIVNERVDNPETKFLRQVIGIIHQHMGDNDLDAVRLARKLFLSESQVYRKLKAISGKSTAIFIRSVRLQKARELIRTTDLPISQVAYEVGFNDPSWFSRAFKDEFGKTPTDMLARSSDEPS